MTDQPPNVDPEVKAWLERRMTRRQALSTAGKAAIGIAAVAIVGGGAYYAVTSQAPSSTTSSGSSSGTSSMTSTPSAGGFTGNPSTLRNFITAGPRGSDSFGPL